MHEETVKMRMMNVALFAYTGNLKKGKTAFVTIGFYSPLWDDVSHFCFLVRAPETLYSRLLLANPPLCICLAQLLKPLRLLSGRIPSIIAL
jgi:hypothetical protein